MWWALHVSHAWQFMSWICCQLLHNACCQISASSNTFVRAHTCLFLQGDVRRWFGGGSGCHTNSGVRGEVRSRDAYASCTVLDQCTNMSALSTRERCRWVQARSTFITAERLSNARLRTASRRGCRLPHRQSRTHRRTLALTEEAPRYTCACMPSVGRNSIVRTTLRITQTRIREQGPLYARCCPARKGLLHRAT